MRQKDAFHKALSLARSISDEMPKVAVRNKCRFFKILVGRTAIIRGLLFALLPETIAVHPLEL